MLTQAQKQLAHCQFDIALSCLAPVLDSSAAVKKQRSRMDLLRPCYVISAAYQRGAARASIKKPAQAIISRFETF